MNRNFHRTRAVAVLALLASGCDELGLGPHPAASTPSPSAAPAQAIADLRPHEGASYSDFAAGVGARYSPEELGLNAADRARFWRTMAVSRPGELVRGGGAEALVFRGCADTGCEEGLGVIAIDTSSGAAFAAVRDAGGADVLTPNDRVEALLRLNSPARRWDDPALTQATAGEMATP